MYRRQKNKGQSILEYTTIIIIAMAVFLAMGPYMKRAMQGSWKTAVDPLGDQYDTSKTFTDIRHTIQANTVVSVRTVSNATTQQMWTLRSDVSNSTERKSGKSTIFPEYQ